MFPEEAERASSHYPREPYRQKMTFVYRRLQATLEAAGRPWRADHRPGPGPTRRRRRSSPTCAWSRRACAGTPAPASRRAVSDALVTQAEVFGFHLATLDLRQHAGRHTAALDEILSRYGIAERYRHLDEAERQAVLTAELEARAAAHPGPPRLQRARPTRRWRSSASIRRAHERVGPEAIRTYIVSMTRGPSDLLAVLLLARDAGVDEQLDVVPLFETVEDLHQAPGHAGGAVRPTRSTGATSTSAAGGRR